MSENVVLTKDQDLAIQELKEDYSVDDLVKTFLKDGYIYNYSILNNISKHDFAKALYMGYEIEQPKFKVGDWAVILTTNTVEKVIDIKGTEIFLSGGIGSVHSLQIRHANKEEAFWAKIGRKVKEFREGDVMLSINKRDTCMYVKNEESSVTDDWISIDEAKQWYEDNDFKGFYPAESYVSFNKV